MRSIVELTSAHWELASAAAARAMSPGNSNRRHFDDENADDRQQERHDGSIEEVSSAFSRNDLFDRVTSGFRHPTGLGLVPVRPHARERVPIVQCAAHGGNGNASHRLLPRILPYKLRILRDQIQRLLAG